MKRILAVLLTILMVFSLTACGEKRKVEKAKDDIVDIVEQYLDGEITSVEAYQMLDEYEQSLEKLHYKGIDSSVGYDLEYNLAMFELMLRTAAMGADNYDEIFEFLNEFKEE